MREEMSEPSAFVVRPAFSASNYRGRPSPPAGTAGRSFALAPSMVAGVATGAASRPRMMSPSSSMASVGCGTDPNDFVGGTSKFSSVTAAKVSVGCGPKPLPSQFEYVIVPASAPQPSPSCPAMLFQKRLAVSLSSPVPRPTHASTSFPVASPALAPTPGIVIRPPTFTITRSPTVTTAPRMMGVTSVASVAPVNGTSNQTKTTTNRTSVYVPVNYIPTSGAYLTSNQGAVPSVTPAIQNHLNVDVTPSPNLPTSSSMPVTSSHLRPPSQLVVRSPVKKVSGISTSTPSSVLQFSTPGHGNIFPVLSNGQLYFLQQTARTTTITSASVPTVTVSKPSSSNVSAFSAKPCSSSLSSTLHTFRFRRPKFESEGNPRLCAQPVEVAAKLHTESIESQRKVLSMTKATFLADKGCQSTLKYIPKKKQKRRKEIVTRVRVDPDRNGIQSSIKLFPQISVALNGGSKLDPLAAVTSVLQANNSSIQVFPVPEEEETVKSVDGCDRCLASSATGFRLAKSTVANADFTYSSPNSSILLPSAPPSSYARPVPPPPSIGVESGISVMSEEPSVSSDSRRVNFVTKHTPVDGIRVPVKSPPLMPTSPKRKSSHAPKDNVAPLFPEARQPFVVASPKPADREMRPRAVNNSPPHVPNIVVEPLKEAPSKTEPPVLDEFDVLLRSCNPREKWGKRSRDPAPEVTETPAECHTRIETSAPDTEGSSGEMPSSSAASNTVSEERKCNDSAIERRSQSEKRKKKKKKNKNKNKKGDEESEKSKTKLNGSKRNDRKRAKYRKKLRRKADEEIRKEGSIVGVEYLQETGGCGVDNMVDKVKRDDVSSEKRIQKNKGSVKSGESSRRKKAKKEKNLKVEIRKQKKVVTSGEERLKTERNEALPRDSIKGGVKPKSRKGKKIRPEAGISGKTEAPAETRKAEDLKFPGASKKSAKKKEVENSTKMWSDHGKERSRTGRILKASSDGQKAPKRARLPKTDASPLTVVTVTKKPIPLPLERLRDLRTAVCPDEQNQRERISRGTRSTPIDHLDDYALFACAPPLPRQEFWFRASAFLPCPSLLSSTPATRELECEFPDDGRSVSESSDSSIEDSPVEKRRKLLLHVKRNLRAENRQLKESTRTQVFKTGSKSMQVVKELLRSAKQHPSRLLCYRLDEFAAEERRCLKAASKRRSLIPKKCAFVTNKEDGIHLQFCGAASLPLAAFCRRHIVEAPQQHLFERCESFNEDRCCGNPAFLVRNDAPICEAHLLPHLTPSPVVACKAMNQTGKKKPKKRSRGGPFLRKRRRKQTKKSSAPPLKPPPSPPTPPGRRSPSPTSSLTASDDFVPKNGEVLEPPFIADPSLVLPDIPDPDHLLDGAYISDVLCRIMPDDAFSELFEENGVSHLEPSIEESKALEEALEASYFDVLSLQQGIMEKLSELPPQGQSPANEDSPPPVHPASASTPVINPSSPLPSTMQPSTTVARRSPPPPSVHSLHDYPRNIFPNAPSFPRLSSKDDRPEIPSSSSSTLCVERLLPPPPPYSTAVMASSNPAYDVASSWSSSSSSSSMRYYGPSRDPTTPDQFFNMYPSQGPPSLPTTSVTFPASSVPFPSAFPPMNVCVDSAAVPEAISVHPVPASTGAGTVVGLPCQNAKPREIVLESHVIPTPVGLRPENPSIRTVVTLAPAASNS